MMLEGAQVWAEEDERQLTVSISMNGFHKEGISRIQAFLKAGSGVLRACGIQACNKIKCLNKKCSSAPLFLTSGPVILSKTLKMLHSRNDKIIPSCTGYVPEWFLSPLTSTIISLPCPPMFHSLLVVLYLRFLGYKAMTDLQIPLAEWV